MSDSLVNVTTLATGTPIDNSSVTTGAGTVNRQRTAIFDPSANQGAAVDASGRLMTGTPAVTPTETNPTITGSSSTVLSANTSAKYRFIQNTTATPAWLSLAGSVVTVGSGMYIGPYGTYELSLGNGNMITGKITAISTSGSLVFYCIEGA